MSHFLHLILAAALMVVAPSGFSQESVELLGLSKPCTSQEDWKISKVIRATSNAGPNKHENGVAIEDQANSLDIDFKTFDEHWNVLSGLAQGKQSSVKSFSFALSMRNSSSNSVTKTFAEYWISRSMLQAGLVHIAWSGFSAIAQRDQNSNPKAGSLSAIALIQIAAINCLKEIQISHPGLSGERPSISAGKLEQLLMQAAQNNYKEGTLKDLLVYLIQESFMSGTGSTGDKRGQRHASVNLAGVLEKLMADPKHLTLIAPTYHLLNALSSLRISQLKKSNDHFLALFSTLEKTSSLNSSNSNDEFSKYLDSFYLLHARVLYELGHFLQAKTQLHKVKKTSNDLTQSLQELAWSYLKNGNFNEAIGAATGLQTGLLKNTFAPEGPMVMAMAMNELCQFPDSIKAINHFKRNYEKPYRYLGSLKEQEKDNLYPFAVKYLRGQPSFVPSRIASEWIKSPLFLSIQDELNLLKREGRLSKTLALSGVSEQRLLAMDVIKLSKELIPRIQFARSKLKPGQSLSESMEPRLQSDIDLIQSKISGFLKIGAAGIVWKRILANHPSTGLDFQNKKIGTINRELSQITYKIKTMIEEVSENIQLIEIEIFNGASHDLIWQNAHPEYKEFAKNLKESNRKGESTKVWNWGQVSIGEESESEVWEDEVGSFRADLEDNCGSKDKFLTIALSKT